MSKRGRFDPNRFHVLWAYVGIDNSGREGIVRSPATALPMIRRSLSEAMDLYETAQAVADADGRELRLVVFRRVYVARVVVPRKRLPAIAVYTGGQGHGRRERS